MDVSGWRQNRWRTNVEFIWTSEFEVDQPEILGSLNDGHEVVCDKFYAYRFGNKQHTIVERVWVETYKVNGVKAFHIPREHFDHKKDPFQMKLTRGSHVEGDNAK